MPVITTVNCWFARHVSDYMITGITTVGLQGMPVITAVTTVDLEGMPVITAVITVGLQCMLVIIVKY